MMTFNVEVLLKGHDQVVEEVLHRDGPEASDWSVDDARDVLRLILGSFDRVLHPDAGNRPVELRGLSWIVTPVDGGVVIAIEIPSGAVVAGPFDAEVDPLTDVLTRALVRPSEPPPTIH